MTKQITLEEALELVSFYHSDKCGWQVHDVNSYVLGSLYGAVNGNIYSDVLGSVVGNVFGDIHGDVKGGVWGKIKGQSWKFIETPKDKLQRLITELGNQELIDAFNQMENN